MDAAYRKNFLHAGALAQQVRAYGKSLIVKGASYNDVIAKINAKIAALGAIAAFPPQIALNHVAAHFLPLPHDDIIFKDETIKLDIGVCYQGAIGDCAVTIDLSGKYQNLVDAVEAALLNAEKIIQVGLKIREIGKTIEETIASFGFKAIKNLSGHGLGYYKIHTPPTIPNYDDASSRAVIQPGMTFAIEPFATDGVGLIFEKGFPTIYSLVNAKALQPLSSLALELLAQAKRFGGLPFAIHDLISVQPSLPLVKQGLAELCAAKVLMGYGPLIEQGLGQVAQAENSILVDDKGKVFVSTR